MTNFTATRMGTLSAERNSMKDDVDDGGDSQRVAARRAMEWQREESAKIPSGVPLTTFLGPHETGPVPELNWNPSDNVPLPYDPVDDATPAELEAVYSSAKDSAPSVLRFYAGKSFAEGRKAHNAHLISRGLAPIREGAK